jgi:ribosome-binding protein aMBF1 (putative translation factor)
MFSESLRQIEVCIKGEPEFIEITIGYVGTPINQFRVPNTKVVQEKLKKFLSDLDDDSCTSWEKGVAWRDLAAKRIDRYSESGIALRGARIREGISQKELSALTNMSQENLSRMENGKRVIGEKAAKKLGSVLKVDYHLLMSK